MTSEAVSLLRWVTVDEYTCIEHNYSTYCEKPMFLRAPVVGKDVLLGFGGSSFDHLHT